MRLAVTSPSVDRRHGTERALAELVERLASQFACEIHLYAQRVEDLSVLRPGESPTKKAGAIYWHRVPSLAGPHILRFAFWYLFNHWRRLWDRLVHGLRFDLVFSPGINCPDADVILVHAIFHRLAELQRVSSQRGVRGLHRRAYYRMVCGLERRIYSNRRVALAAVSRRTAGQLGRYFDRDDVTVIPNGVDVEYFHPAALFPLRDAARRLWNFAADEKVLLLIGNDWQNKGLHTVLEAIALCRELPLRLLVVGQDDSAPFFTRARQLDLAGRVAFALPTADVRTFYAAADILVAPSLEDSFNLPALEAMACGLPVILSSNAGIGEWIHAGEDAILLKDPQDVSELSSLIRSLLSDPEKTRQLCNRAVQTASSLSWERHAAAVHRLLTASLRARSSLA